MKQLADGVWQLDGFPPNVVNVYLADDVLIDAGSPLDTRRILGQLRGRTLSAHALTHAHPDHQGASAAVCRDFGVPYWVGANDAAWAEDPGLMATGMRPPLVPGIVTDNPLGRLVVRRVAGPAWPVERHLQEGDEVAGFVVLETPGHTPGQVSYWRESDRTLICGDVVWNLDFTLGVTGLTTPTVNQDAARNHRSIRSLAELEPHLVCFGHGPPLRDTRKFVEFCSRA